MPIFNLFHLNDCQFFNFYKIEKIVELYGINYNNLQTLWKYFKINFFNIYSSASKIGET